jgi:hypothetical protein
MRRARNAGPDHRLEFAADSEGRVLRVLDPAGVELERQRYFELSKPLLCLSMGSCGSRKPG